jgi:hypothetical protein
VGSDEFSRRFLLKTAGDSMFPAGVAAASITYKASSASEQRSRSAE